jgi:hypothetical protein
MSPLAEGAPALLAELAEAPMLPKTRKKRRILQHPP